MTHYPLSALAHLLGLTLSQSADTPIEILLTDSRSLVFPERTLFFALVTEKGDGHLYLDDLYHCGVRAFVVSQDIDSSHYPDAAFLRVADTLKALQTLARAHRNTLTMPIVGITGSNGKTTLKEILYQLLRPSVRVARSPRSYNSSIGVPLSLWGIRPEQDIALIEAGISNPEEMDILERMIRPSLGIITNIGEAHQENFPSLESKCLEKLRLFRDCETIVCCLDDPLIVHCLEKASLGHKVIGWSRRDSSAQVFVKEIHCRPKETDLTILLMGKTLTYTLPYTDDGAIHNTLLAITALLKLRPTLLWDPHLLSELEPISMRLEVVQGAEGMILINDTYNSDYESLQIALDFLLRRNTDHRPLALILSDIHESGTLPADLYRRVSMLVSRYPLSRLYLIGEDLSRCRDLFPQAHHIYHTTEEMLHNLHREDLRGHLILLKGSRSARFERIVHALERRTHQTILDVNLSHLAHNLDYYRSQLPPATKIICMVKAFGYGAGSYEIGKTLSDRRCDYLAVAVADEGIELREQGIELPIIVMNPEVSTFAHLIEHRLQPEIYSLSLLRKFITLADSHGEQGYPIHLKWDTGMHRLGFDPEQMDQVCSLLMHSDAVRVASIFTHLAAADDPREDAFTRTQLDRFLLLREELTARLSYPFFAHALNTSGIMRFPQHALDMVRLGIGLYGISPCSEPCPGLLPVATLRTVVLQVREVAAGETIGYGRRGVVSAPSRIAVIPIGYADGISRKLGEGAITFRTPAGHLVPTIGSICMDTLMLDVSDAPEVEEGSEIVLFDESLPIERLAAASGTIPYEILACLSPRITRRYYSE